MPEPQEHQPVVAIVATRDFGELGSMSLFSQGVSGVVFHSFVPESLSGTAGSNNVSFHDAQDLAGKITKSGAELVVFFSGYLLTTGELMPLEDAEWLLETLQGNGLILVTGDPFLGMIPQRDRRGDFDLSAFRPTDLGWFRRMAFRFFEYRVRRRTLANYARLRELLAPHPHLYLSPIPPGDWHGPSQTYSFFNPGIRPVEPEQDLWVFILADLDGRFQLGQQGEDFFSRLSQRLTEALEDFEKRVVLITPSWVSQKLDEGVRLHDRFQAEDRLAHSDFIALLSKAGRAFYWNRISQSILFRIYQNGRTHFFGTGHMSAILPDVIPLIERIYYGGGFSPDLDLSNPLTDEALAFTENRFEESLRRIQQSPGPADLVNQLRSDHPED